MTMSAIGLGAGTKEFAQRPNLLRVSIGESAEPSALTGLNWETLALLETNVDDLNPQLWEAVFEALFAAGALDGPGTTRDCHEEGPPGAKARRLV